MKIRAASVLVVDDQESTAYLARIMLEAVGFVVSTTTESRTAIQQINASRYDALLLDLHLGEMSALELLAQCPLSPPTVLTTGSLAEISMTDAQGLGVVEVIRKPFTAAELVASIDRAVTRARRTGPSDNTAIYLDMPVVTEVRNVAGRSAGDRFVRKAIADAVQLIDQMSEAGKTMQSASWLSHVQALAGIAATLGARALKRAAEEALNLPFSEIPTRSTAIVERLRNILTKTSEQLIVVDDLLSERERACLKHVAQGLETGAIARKLGVTPKTIEYYIQKAGAKLDARGRAAIVAQAIRRGEI